MGCLENLVHRVLKALLVAQAPLGMRVLLEWLGSEGLLDQKDPMDPRERKETVVPMDLLDLL